jgi:hypothetical protein
VQDKKTRASLVHQLMPELQSMYFGDELNLKKYPHLKQIVQTGFKAIRGVNMYKDLTVYATPSMSSKQIPVN